MTMFTTSPASPADQLNRDIAHWREKARSAQQAASNHKYCLELAQRELNEARDAVKMYEGMRASLKKK